MPQRQLNFRSRLEPIWSEIRAGPVAIASKRVTRAATADDIDTVLTLMDCTYSDLGNAAGESSEMAHEIAKA